MHTLVSYIIILKISYSCIKNHHNVLNIASFNTMKFEVMVTIFFFTEGHKKKRKILSWPKSYKKSNHSSTDKKKLCSKILLFFSWRLMQNTKYLSV